MGEEGGPFRVASPPDLTAAHRVAAGACEARARAVERGGGAPPAAAFAARALLEGRLQAAPSHRPLRSRREVPLVLGEVREMVIQNTGHASIDSADSSRSYRGCLHVFDERCVACVLRNFYRVGPCASMQ